MGSSDTRFENELKREYLTNIEWVENGPWFVQRAAGSHGDFDLWAVRGTTVNFGHGPMVIPDLRLIQVKKVADKVAYTSASSGKLREEIETVQGYIDEYVWLESEQYGASAHIAVRYTDRSIDASKEAKWNVFPFAGREPEEPLRWGEGAPLREVFA